MSERCTNCGEPLPEREITPDAFERWAGRNREAAMRMLRVEEKGAAPRFGLVPRVVEVDGEKRLRVERPG